MEFDETKILFIAKQVDIANTAILKDEINN